MRDKAKVPLRQIVDHRQKMAYRTSQTIVADDEKHIARAMLLNGHAAASRTQFDLLASVAYSSVETRA